jgi:CheY-like chemotaxis protein
VTRRVLVVDDSEDLRTVATVALRTVAKWDVITASSGSEAVEVAARERPDAILLDVMMPSLDGPATVVRLRQKDVTKATPVIFLTAKQQPSDLERFATYDVAGIIAKPFDPMTLASEVSRILRWEP